MKRTVFAAFVAFWASLATLVAVDWLSPPAIAEAAAADTVTVDAVAAHASVDDCWVIIEGKVYDITTYIPQHPTPAAVLLPWCGRDATKGMRTKGYGREHSPTAWGLLEQLQIGVLGK